MAFSTQQITALVLSSCFAAGLNVYATIAALGLLGRAHVVDLPSSLDIVTHWSIIAVSLALYLVEFVADKVPGIDLVWNALQTFVRVPVAALFAYTASAHLSATEQLLTTSLGGFVALVANGGKTAARMAVTPSPEPFSNIALSLGEDAIAVFVVWLGGQHPYWAAGMALALMVIVFTVIRTVVRAAQAVFRGARRQLSTADS